MKRWIRLVSMCGLSLLILFLFSAVAPTTVHAGMVLTEEEESVPDPKLNVQAKSMVKDSTFTLRVYNLTENQKVSYKSDDTEIASVSKKGVITAKGIGSATITVTVKDSSAGSSTILTCDVTVGPPAISIKLTLTELTLELDKKTSLKARLKPNTTAEIAAYDSLDPETATVSATGKVTAKAVGTTTIYAEIANGKFDKCVITVVEAADEKEDKAEEGTASESGSESNNSTEPSKKAK